MTENNAEVEGLSEKYEKGFSDRLRTLRNERKLSAREMSVELGQNVNYVNLIENGKRLPSMQGFFLLCEYLKITPADFFMAQNFNCASEKKYSQKDELIDALNKLSSQQISAILQIIKVFSKL